MIIFHYHPTSGEFLSIGEADASPLEKNTYLVPAHATDIEPPKEQSGTARVFVDDAWSMVADHRGETWFKPITAEPVVIKALGDPASVGLLAVAPVVVLPTPSELDQAALNAILAEQGSVVRGIAQLMLDEINNLRVKGGDAAYTKPQFVAALKAKMRS